MAAQENSTPLVQTLSSRIAEWFDTRLNPVFVKDIRCWLRSRRFLIIFFIGMLAALGVSIITIIIAGTSDSTIGGIMYAILIGILGFLLGGVVPYLIQDKFADELSNRSTELALISRLTAGKMIRGKILSGTAAALLFFAAIGPSLMIAYMLGGVDIVTVLYTITVLLFLSSIMTLIGVVIVAIGGKKRLKLLNVLAYLAGGVSLAFLMPTIVQAAQFTAIFEDITFWLFNAYALAHIIPCALFFYFVALSRLSFEADNRDTRPRVMLTIFMLISFTSIMLTQKISTLAGISPPGIREAITMAVVFSLGIFFVGSLFIMNTPQTPSPRTISRWPRWRTFALIFYPGTGRLYAYFLAHFIFLFGASFLLIYISAADRFYIVSGAVLCIFATLAFATVVYHILEQILKNMGKSFPRGIAIICILLVWNIMAVSLYVIAASFANTSHGAEWAMLYCPITAIGYLNAFGNPGSRYFTMLVPTLAFFLPGLVLWLKGTFNAIIEARQFRKPPKVKNLDLEEEYNLDD